MTEEQRYIGAAMAIVAVVVVVLVLVMTGAL
jgi:hypothetical protein